MSGPAPKPTKIKALEGNRGKRPLNDQEPEPDVCIPRKPTVLQGNAATEWKKITKQLAALGLLTQIDTTALAAYCQVYARWCEAEKELRKTGMIIKAPSGYPVMSPYLSIINNCLTQIKGFMAEFGMTPASRSRVKVDKKKDKKNSFEDV